MATAISVKNLSKNYGKVAALQDVSLEIPDGQIIGLVGPNGAGKSTLIKSIIGALDLSKGSVTVLEVDAIKQRWSLRAKLGYMPQEQSLYNDLSALENVAFYARLHSVPNSHARAEKVLSNLDLGERLDSPVYTLSGGMQSRVSLACALVHDPQLLVLDEPTAGLDPLLKRQLWERFRTLTAQGKTLLISTHLMDEAVLCDKVVLLQNGKVIAYDAPHALIATGNVILRFHEQNRHWNETIPAEGRAIAQALKQHGLSTAIDRLDIDTESLEDVMVTLLKEKGKQ